MTDKLRKRIRRFAWAATALTAAPVGEAAAAGPLDACHAIANEAAVAAVERTPWIGQAAAVGDPFALRPGVLRARVSLFGPQSAFFDVDVAVDPGCTVRSTSVRLDSNPWPWR